MGAQKREKHNLLSQISRFDESDESNNLIDVDLDIWKSCQSYLHKIYLNEEMYWQ